MTLPDEQVIAGQIASQFQAQLQSMTDLHNVVVSMLYGNKWKITKTKGLDPRVALTVAGLLTKACKTFRAVQILCAAGLGTDAGTAARSLFETTVAIMFILKTRSKERVRLFHAHSYEQRLKMLNHWKRTKGLKRKATKKMFANVEADRARWLEKLPIDVNIQHWSGKGSLEQAVQTLKGDITYAIFFRDTSRYAHVADFNEHVDFDEAANRLIFKLTPGFDHVGEQAEVSKMMLWNAAARINERLGLGYDDMLNRHKPHREGLLRSGDAEQQC